MTIEIFGKRKQTRRKQEFRACSGFNGDQVHEILQENRALGLRASVDLRDHGCPDQTFAAVVERRAKLLGIRKPTEFITDAERRAQAARTAALISADAEFDGLNREILENYGK